MAGGAVTRPRTTFVLGVTLLATALLPGTGSAQEDPATEAPANESQPPSDDFDELAEEAAEAGRVRTIVRLDAGTDPQAIDASQAELEDDLAGTDHEIVSEFEQVPFSVVEAAPDAVDALEASDVVASVVEDGLATPTLDQSAPFINADDAWTAGADGAGRVVAVIDTGVLSTHETLNGKVVAQACFADDDGNVGGAGDCPNGQPTQTSGTNPAAPCPFSGCNHGTHVANTVAGNEPPPSPEHDGIARGAQIAAVQVFHESNNSPPIAAWFSDIALGLQWVLAEATDATPLPIDAVNLSLGAFPQVSQTECDIFDAGLIGGPGGLVEQLNDAGVATVAAAGNESQNDAVSYPACLSGVVSVGATMNPTDALRSTSNSAQFLSLLAPGQSIEAASTGSPTGYTTLSGTSMASAHVAGGWALLQQAAPAATNADILAALQDTGVLIEDPQVSMFDSATSPIGGTYVPITGDFDGDSRFDIWWYAPGSGADYIFWGRADGGFDSTSQPIGGVYRPVSGDFDGDGRWDVFWHGPGRTADYVFWGNANRTFTSASRSVSGSYTPFTGDFDGDTRWDIYWYRPGSGSEAIWEGTGNRNVPFTGKATSPVSGTYAAVTGDFDDQGGDDIFWHSGPATDYLFSDYEISSPAGHFGDHDPYSIGGSYRPRTGDFDGDGGERDDIFFYAPGAATDYVFRGPGGDGGHPPTGQFAPFNTAKTESIAGNYNPLPGDFDGDDLWDVFLYQAGPGADWVFFGGGRFEFPRIDVNAARLDLIAP